MRNYLRKESNSSKLEPPKLDPSSLSREKSPAPYTQIFPAKEKHKNKWEGEKNREAVSWRVSAVDEGVDSAADADSHFQFRYANKCLPFHPAVVLNETCLWISISSSATVYFWSPGLFARSHSRKHACTCMMRCWDVFKLLSHVTNRAVDPPVCPASAETCLLGLFRLVFCFWPHILSI